MPTIKLYGKRSSIYEYVEKHILRISFEAKINCSILEINDVDQFLSKKIKAIPVIEFNKRFYHFENTFNLKKNLKQFTKDLLKYYNYGILPTALCILNNKEVNFNTFLFLKRFATRNKVILKTYCVLPQSQKEANKKSIDDFFKFIENLETEWKSDIQSSAIIESNVSYVAKTKLVNTLTKNEKPSIIFYIYSTFDEVIKMEKSLSNTKNCIIYISSKSSNLLSELNFTVEKNKLSHHENSKLYIVKRDLFKKNYNSNLNCLNKPLIVF